MSDDFDDDLSDFGVSRQPRAEIKQPPKDFAHSEVCFACRGTGKFRGYSGRIVGECFKCKGAGKRTFKTSPDARAKARENAHQRKAKGRLEWLNEHKPEVEWLQKAAARNIARNGTFDFPAKIIESIAQWGSLTDPQLAAVHKLMARDAERAKQRDAERKVRHDNAPAIDASKIETAFGNARRSAERPGMQGIWLKPLNLKSGAFDITFQPGSIGSQWEGKIFVTSRLGDKRKLGVIVDGKFVARFECTPAEQAAVMDCCNDPAKAAVAFGKAWGVCSICHRQLTNDESIARGIGPICAEKFGF